MPPKTWVAAMSTHSNESPNRRDGGGRDATIQRKITPGTASGSKELRLTTVSERIMDGHQSDPAGSGSRVARILLVFTVALGAFLLANVASFFLLSDGYGVQP